MKGTRKQRSSNRKTRRQKGGVRRPCPIRNAGGIGQQIVNIWKLTLKYLQEDYDEDYRGEHHWWTGGSCNLWVWKHCETHDNYSDNHIDVFWRNFDKYQIGIKVTRNGKNAGVFNYTVDEGSNNEIASEIAGYIDYVYNDRLYCAQFDLPFAWAGEKLREIDSKYVYTYDCNYMKFWKRTNDYYTIEVRWYDDDVYSFTLICDLYWGEEFVRSEEIELNSENFCNNSFFRDMAKALNGVYGRLNL